jgi:PAT family beta-lactamase induction signal transducer AmpG
VISLIGWGIIEIITKAIFTQQLGWTLVELTEVTGGLAVFTKLGGALAGGYLADRVGRKATMIVGFGTYGVLAILFGMSSGYWSDRDFATSYLLTIEFFLAMGSVGFLSMSMRISWTTAAATVFTIYMTVSNIGHVAGNYLVGPIRGEGGLDLSYEDTFLLAGLLMLVPLLLLYVVKPEVIDRLKAQAPPYDASSERIVE